MHWKFPTTLALAVFVACTATRTESTAPAVEELGSTRNSRVAIETQGGARPLVFLAGEIGVEEQKRLYELAPNVRVLVGLSRERALELAGEAHGADARFLSSEFLAAAPELRWVCAQSAGVDRYLALSELHEREDLLLTNMRGVHGPAIADHVFALLLTLSRDLRTAWTAQDAGRWGLGEPALEPFALSGRTLCVVGLGGIGTEVARRAKGFRMRVVATRRSEATAPEFVDRVELADKLFELLPESDVVVLCVPLTSETERLIDARALAAMKRGSILVNIARGKVVDTSALLAALESGHLGGACLDVSEPEPLPEGHPLWRLPNVVITPHVAAQAALTGERSRALFRENMRRFGAGEPLLNVVDKAAGY